MIFGVWAMTSVFISFNYLPASISFMIFNVNPIFVMILAYIFLSENLTKIKAGCCVGAFIGIIIVGFGRKNEKSDEKSQFIGILFALSAATGASLAYVCMRKINTEIHFIFSPFYLSLGSASICIGGFFINNELLHFELYGT